MSRMLHMAKVRVETGQVFAIPLSANRFGIGQIVDAATKELYVVVYDVISDGLPPDAAAVIGKVPFLGALTLDAKIWHGDWPVLGTELGNLDAIAHPIYKVGHKGSLFLESRDRMIFRQAMPGEAEKLMFRTVVAPVRLENALKAHNGLGQWHPHYDELLYDYAISSSKLMPC